MIRRDATGRSRGGDDAPAQFTDGGMRAEHRLRGRSPQADDHRGLHPIDLGFEPRLAGARLPRARRLVDALLAARGPN
jgi:hypothetical protein